MIESLRPQTRGECEHLPKPCPFFSCKHHALWILTPTQINQLSDERILEMFEKLPNHASCTLDLVDHFTYKPRNDNDDTRGVGERFCMTLQEIANVYPTGGISRERVRQLIECKGNQYRKSPYGYGAIKRLKHYTRARILRPFVDTSFDFCQIA